MQETYCLRCGEWLPNQKAIVKWQFGSATPEGRVRTIIIFNVINALMGLFSAVALCVTYVGSPDAKWSIYVAAAFCLGFAVHQCSSLFIALKLRQHLIKSRGKNP
ncbi:MAG: hypothetical protein ACRD4L_04160 [Pyrinomonadaceae bacterium]